MLIPSVHEIPDPRLSREDELRVRYSAMRPVLVVSYRVAGMTLEARRMYGVGNVHTLVIG